MGPLSCFVIIVMMMMMMMMMMLLLLLVLLLLVLLLLVLLFLWCGCFGVVLLHCCLMAVAILNNKSGDGCAGGGYVGDDGVQ